MADTQKRVETDFEAFTKEQIKHYSEFKNNIKVESDEVSIRMENLEKELAELKQRAYDNVSGKLDDFEKDFFADLSKRGEDLTVSLGEWKNSFDSKLENITQTYQDKQKAIEVEYLKQLSDKIAKLQESLDDKFTRLDSSFGERENLLDGKVTQLESEISNFSDDYLNRLALAKEEASSKLQEEFDKYINSINEQVKTFEQEITQHLSSISSEVDNSRNQSATILEGIRDDFDLWKERIHSQFEDAKVTNLSL